MISIHIFDTASIPNQQVREWLHVNKIEATFMWPRPTIIFYNNDDALLFILKFNGKRIATPLDNISEINDEENIN